MKTDRSLRQIKINYELYVRVKQYCIIKQFTLTDLYDHILEWYFSEHLISENLAIFHASHKGGKRLSLWIKQKHLHKIITLSKTYDISNARVIYTALILYVTHHTI